MYGLGLPVSSSNLKITHNGVDYTLVLGTDTFTRVGKDGNEVILPLNGGDNFIGEVLEGAWKKGYTGAWKAANPFTAILESTNNLIELGGLSDTQNVWVYGWIDGHHPIVMMNELEVTILLEVPTHTASGANQGFKFRFFIINDKIVSQPNSEDDYIKIEMDVTNGGLLLNIFKRIGGAGEVTLFHGSTYDGDTIRAATGRVTIWRVVFHDGVAGADSPGDVRHMHVWLKQGATRAAADGATEYELIDAVLVAHASPYNISDLLFNVGYPAYEIGTEDDLVNFKQDNDDEAMSEYLKVSYPALFALKYDFVDASYGFGDVELWDAKGSAVEADWQQVFDEDHVFSGDAYLQNGTIRLHVDEAIQYGLKLYGYYGAAWRMPADQIRLYFPDDAKALRYPFLEKIVQVSPEKVVVDVKMCDLAVNDNDYYLRIRLTLTRGSYALKMEVLEAYPLQIVRVWYYNSTVVRFGYVGDDEIGDDDMGEDGENVTLTDNFLVAFDDVEEACLFGMFTDKKPTAGSAEFQAIDGGDLQIREIAASDVLSTTIWFYITPFSLVANLFAEAEDDPAKTTISGAAREYIDAAHDGFTDMSDMVTEAQPDASKDDMYEDDETKWTQAANVTGTEDTTNEKTGTSCYQMVSLTRVADLLATYDYGAAHDFSGLKYVGAWIYGANEGGTFKLRFIDTDGDWAEYHLTDNFAGWRWFCFTVASPDAVNLTPDFSIMRYLELYETTRNDATWRIDLTTFYDGLWVEQANCTITINDVTDVQVGNYMTEVTSTGAAGVNADVFPIVPLSILKFDELKFWAQRTGGSDFTQNIQIFDGDGDQVTSPAFDASGAISQFTFDLPHSSADLQGWTEGGTFDFGGPIAYVRIAGWTADGAGETLILDDMHFAIGTTTTRGRGETLSGGEAVVLDVQNDDVTYTITSGTDLPSGRYLLFSRAKDTDQVVDDFGMRAYKNAAPAEIRNEENAEVTEQLAATFSYDGIIFDISEEDVAALNTIQLRFIKVTATENTIFVDYFLLVPCGDGEDFPQDLAHGALRKFTKPRRLYVR